MVCCCAVRVRHVPALPVPSWRDTPRKHWDTLTLQVPPSPPAPHSVFRTLQSRASPPSPPARTLSQRSRCPPADGWLHPVRAVQSRWIGAATAPCVPCPCQSCTPIDGPRLRLLRAARCLYSGRERSLNRLVETDDACWWRTGAVADPRKARPHAAARTQCPRRCLTRRPACRAALGLGLWPWPSPSQAAACHEKRASPPSKVQSARES